MYKFAKYTIPGNLKKGHICIFLLPTYFPVSRLTQQIQYIFSYSVCSDHIIILEIYEFHMLEFLGVQIQYFIVFYMFTINKSRKIYIL